MSTHFNDIFSKDSIIVHPQTGLFLSYLGSYTPSETIIHNSAIFPLTTSACYFLPLSAARSIPSCNITSKRYKRFIHNIVFLGSAALSRKLSRTNEMKLQNLQQQMEIVQKSLSNYFESIQAHRARLAKLESNQTSLTEEFQMTQKVLDAMLPTINSHSRILNTLENGMKRLYNHFQHSALYSAISQIFQNDLTLNYLSPEDLNKVLHDVIQQGNITFNSDHGSVPIVQLITKFLVRQQIDFIPIPLNTDQNSEEIGRLVITNFFAVPDQNQTPFQIYKVLAAPFVRNNEIIQLTHIPRCWAINPADNTTMEWYDSAECECDFRSTSSCRDTPPMRRLSHDTCLGQIISRYPLSKCLTTASPLSVGFVRQLRDNLWISSSSKPLHCTRMSKSDYLSGAEQTSNASEHVNLPRVALVNVTPGYVITCPGFTLTGHPIISNVSLGLILHNDTVFTNNISIMNIYRHIKENTAWLGGKSFKAGADDTTSYVDASAQDNNIQTFRSMYAPILLISISGWMLFGIGSVIICYICRRQQRYSLHHPMFFLSS